MDKFSKYLKDSKLYTDERQSQIDNFDKKNYVSDVDIETQCDYWIFWILDHLDDPTTYLYNLLGLWEK